MDAAHMGADLERVLITEEQIHAKLDELAEQIAEEYEGKDLLLVGVLKGAVMVMADLMRALPVYRPGRLDGRVVLRLRHQVQRRRADPQGPRRRHLRPTRRSSSRTSSTPGLTLSWIKSNLESRSPASVEICTLLRKPDAAKVDVDVRWVGFDIPNEFVVGYGLDYAEAYRGLRVVGTLAPHVYS